MLHIKYDELNVGLNNPFVLVAQGLGSGCVHPWSGGWGTLAGLVVFIIAHYFVPATIWQGWVLAATLLGIPLCTYAERILGDKDPGSVVWDEWCGIWVCFLFVPFHPLLLAIGFVLFRILDVRKPWLIGIVERKLTKGSSIMLDDVLAGIVVNIMLQALWWLFTYLGPIVAT